MINGRNDLPTKKETIIDAVFGKNIVKIEQMV